MNPDPYRRDDSLLYVGCLMLFLVFVAFAYYASRNGLSWAPMGA